MKAFKLESEFSPTGDQPQAIDELVAGLNEGARHQCLLGVTGSGKTFTIANVIEQTGRPTLVLSHNKTLAAQLYSEFTEFFPDNLVEYFVSYYDYYQPEAFIASTGTFIEKDLQINDEIEKLRLSTTSSLMSGRRDVIVVASISCIYGIGNPVEFHKNVISLDVGQKFSRDGLLHRLVETLYHRTRGDFERGAFRVNGDVVDIYLAYTDYALRVEFWGNEIEGLSRIEPDTGKVIEVLETVKIYPANLFVTGKETLQTCIWEIQQDMVKQVEFLESQGLKVEAQRIEERTTHDLEMMRELGFCSGIENYSRYFDRRDQGQRPFCLLDYFPDDFLMVVDESHVTLPQVGAMYGGDRSRKVSLVEHGFRLPSAMDNRPLTADEFNGMLGQAVYVSATPAALELERCEGVIVEQVIRPTGLLDPVIQVKPCTHQVDDLVGEIRATIAMGDRVLVTTLTKKMAEELSRYLDRLNIGCRYIHSDVKTLDRVEILRDLRAGVFDVLVGVNLLREGLDLPEVSLVAVMDADKEGFLRSHRALTQTAGRAARNIAGRVIFYADRVTDSMQQTMDETARPRAKQEAYNEEHGITPTGVKRHQATLIEQSGLIEDRPMHLVADDGGADWAASILNDPVIAGLIEARNSDKLQKVVERTRLEMERAARDLDFVAAARLRDEFQAIEAAAENVAKLG
jgi:excinuclease ABC subunit B